MTRQRMAAWGLVLVLGASLGAAARTRAEASPEGRRNTTAVLGAATLGTALAGKKKAAWILGGATAVAAYRWYGAAQRRKRKQARARSSMRVASYRSNASRTRSASRVMQLRASRPSRPAPRVLSASAAPVQAGLVPMPAAPAVNPVAIATVTPPPTAPVKEGGSSLPGSALLFGGGLLASALGFGLWSAWRRRAAA